MNYSEKMMFFIISYFFLKNEGQSQEELDDQADKIHDDILNLFDSVVMRGASEFFADMGQGLEVRFYNSDPGHYLLKLKMPEQIICRYLEILKLYQFYNKIARRKATPEQLKFMDYFLNFEVVSVTNGLDIQIKKR